MAENNTIKREVSLNSSSSNNNNYYYCLYDKNGVRRAVRPCKQDVFF